MKVQNDKPIIQLDPKIQQLHREDQVQQVTGEQKQAGSSAEKVTISQEAFSIKQIEKELSSVPDVRMDLVNQVKAEVEAGTYTRPAEDVADSLITTSLIESLYR